MDNVFTLADYLVVLCTLLFSLLIGVYYAFCAKQSTNEDLLLGGKSMGKAPIAASMLVTYLSAIAVLGYPAEVYAHGAQIFMNTIIFVIFVPFSIYFFMTVFYQMKLTSVYKYLEDRFESRFVRQFASFIFILQMTIFMGVCLFAPSIAMSTFMGLKTWQSIIGLGLCATIYTSMGGLKAVVWTDVFQLFMILAGMIAIIIQGFVSSGGIMESFRKASQNGRLEFFNFSVDPFMRHNVLNFILGQGFSTFCLFGTHQPQVQRYSSLPSLQHAVHATLFSIPLNVFTIGLCLLTGIVLFSTYDGCDPYASGIITRTDAIVPYFVRNELKFLSGVMGLFTACVFSATLSTLSSGLNSLAAVTWEDFMKHTETFGKMSSKNQANLVRLLAMIYGIISIILAFLAQNMGAILSATLTALGALSGPLGAVFAMGLLMKFINKLGAISGMMTGFLVMMWITVNAFIQNKSHTPLPFNTDECPAYSNIASNFTVNVATKEELEWPEKLYTISYILYPFVGGFVTLIVATVVSILTGGCSSTKRINPKYLHPIIRPNNWRESERSSDLPIIVTKILEKEMCPVSSGHSSYENLPSATPLLSPPPYSEIDKMLLEIELSLAEANEYVSKF